MRVRERVVFVVLLVVVVGALLWLRAYGETNAPCDWFRPQIRPERCVSPTAVPRG